MSADPLHLDAPVHLLPFDLCAQNLKEEEVKEEWMFEPFPSSRALAVIGVQEKPKLAQEGGRQVV